MNRGIYGIEQRIPAMVLLDVQYPVTSFVEFTDLPYDRFREFRIIWMARSDDASTGPHNLTLRFNRSTDSNYFSETLTVTGTTATAAENLAAANTVCGKVPGNNAPAEYYGTGEIEVLFPGDTRFALQGTAASFHAIGTSSGNLQLHEAGFMYTGASDPLSIITIDLATGYFMGKSRFTLYGVT